MWTTILALLGNVLGIGGEYVTKHLDLKKAEMDAKITVTKARAEAEAALALRAQEGEINWDLSAVSQMERSWKDEWFTILLSIPLVLAFLPFEWSRDAVTNGFAQLDKTPDWYASAVAVAIAASFGFRKLVDMIRRK